jgi:hypothetical protein
LILKGRGRLFCFSDPDFRRALSIGPAGFELIEFKEEFLAVA